MTLGASGGTPDRGRPGRSSCSQLVGRSTSASPAAVRLRAPAPEDRPALGALFESTAEFTVEEVRVALEMLDAGDDPHVVAEEDGEIVGYACFGPTPLTEGVWDLYWLVVEASRRSRGIGRTLLERVERCAGAGGRMMLVETSSLPAYAPSRAFYRRNGYEEIARFPDFYRVGDDKIVYRKLLR